MALKDVNALVLDDNRNMRSLLRTILAGLGVGQIEEAASADDAFARIAGGTFDIAFVDFKLSGPDGVSFCQRVRNDPASGNPYLPLIMITAYSERARVQEAINAGVDEFLVKPVRVIDVANRINAVCARRRPFIKSPAYFGPDRRRRSDPQYNGPLRRLSDPGTVHI